MRHTALAEGTRDEILGELEQYGSDRAQQGETEKARAYAQALHAVRAGAVEVRVEHAVYRIIGEHRPDSYVTSSGSRDSVLVRLKGLCEFHAASDRRPELEDAVSAVEHGGLEVFVDGTLYRVVED